MISCFILVIDNFYVKLQIAREHAIPFLETSAKANVHVEKAFMDLAQAILNKVRWSHKSHAPSMRY